MYSRIIYWNCKKNLMMPYKERNSKRNFLVKMQQIYSQQSDKMEPYVGILRWYIEKKLAQLTA